MDNNNLTKLIETASLRLKAINAFNFSESIKKELKIDDYEAGLKLTKKAFEEYMSQLQHAETFANNNDPFIVEEYKSQMDIMEEKRMNFLMEEDALKQLDDKVLKLIKLKFGENSKEYSEINIEIKTE